MSSYPPLSLALKLLDSTLSLYASIESSLSPPLLRVVSAGMVCSVVGTVVVVVSVRLVCVRWEMALSSNIPPNTPAPAAPATAVPE